MAIRFWSILVFVLLQSTLLTTTASYAWPFEYPYEQTEDLEQYASAAISHYNTGLIMQLDERFDDAVKEYKTAIELDGRMLEAWGLLSMVYHAQGKISEAKEAAQKAKELSRERAAELNRRAEELFSRNKISAAASLWQRAKDLDPNLDLSSAARGYECIMGPIWAF
jgi:tetratricopeptide (TPR) repeat protein